MFANYCYYISFYLKSLLSMKSGLRMNSPFDFLLEISHHGYILPRNFRPSVNFPSKNSHPWIVPPMKITNVLRLPPQRVGNHRMFYSRRISPRSVFPLPSPLRTELNSLVSSKHDYFSLFEYP